jgi:hypothetical protein
VPMGRGCYFGEWKDRKELCRRLEQECYPITTIGETNPASSRTARRISIRMKGRRPCGDRGRTRPRRPCQGIPCGADELCRTNLTPQMVA